MEVSMEFIEILRNLEVKLIRHKMGHSGGVKEFVGI